MPSLKQTRGKRATPIAITAEKGPWSEWLKLNTLKSNSVSMIASSTMSYADPIIAPEHSMAPQMPRPLTFFDLPTETQKEVVQHCTTTDLVSLSLVSRYFRDLAAAQIYRNFHIVFPDDDDNSYESDLDGLAAGLDTFATSEYDYARYLKEIILETLSGGSKGERACRQYTNDLSCGKFMNTLFLLTLRRAKALETFKWDVRIELSRPVYKALHNIPALQHLYLRMHTGTSIYQSPPPLQSLGLPPTTDDVTKNVAGLLTYLKAGGSTKDFQGKSSSTNPGNDLSNGHGPPTISGFKNLKSLSVLDMDSLEYISELKTCIQNSSSTLNKLELSFSESLARQARRPPPVDDTGDDSDQEVDEFGNMIPPPPAVALPSTDDVGGPAKALTAQEAKKAQEAVLGRIFGLETASNPKLKTKDEDMSSSSVSDEEKEADSEFESAGKEFIKDLGSLSRKLMFAVNGATRTQQQKDLLNIIGKAAKKYVAEKRESRIGTAGKSGSVENSTAGSSTAKATPVSSSVASVADKADEEDKPKGSEPEEKSAGLFDEEAKKPRKTNQHSTDSSNPDDIDIYEPEEGPDSHESETGSASDSFVAEAVDIATPAQHMVTSNGLSEEVVVTGEDVTQPRVSEDFEAKQSNSVGLVAPSDLTSNTRVDEGTGQNDKISSEEKGKTSSQLLSQNSPDNARHAMNEYVRTTHGLTLKTLAIYLIPIRTSVLSRAVDFHVLRRISLLNVGPQTSFWNHLAKENVISPLPLCKIHTDNVTMPFLNFVNQLDTLVELFILERTTKSSEYSFAPKTTVTNDNIRRLVLKKHISSLKRLVIKNENDYTWDANERFIELLCRKGKKLEELGISFGSLAMHTFDQYLPGLVSLRALHIINFRNDDTCHWVMREVRKFIVDVVSNHPNMKLVYLALGGSVERLVWQIPKIKSKAAFKLKDKGKGKATISGVPTTGSESPFPSLEAAMLTADKVDYSSSDESDGDDDYTPGLKLETIDNGRFYDVYSVHMWKKDVLLGRL